MPLRAVAFQPMPREHSLVTSNISKLHVPFLPLSNWSYSKKDPARIYDAKISTMEPSEKDMSLTATGPITNLAANGNVSIENQHNNNTKNIQNYNSYYEARLPAEIRRFSMVPASLEVHPFIGQHGLSKTAKTIAEKHSRVALWGRNGIGYYYFFGKYLSRGLLLILTGNHDSRHYLPVVCTSAKASMLFSGSMEKACPISTAT